MSLARFEHRIERIERTHHRHLLRALTRYDHALERVQRRQARGRAA